MPRLALQRARSSPTPPPPPQLWVFVVGPPTTECGDRPLLPQKGDSHVAIVLRLRGFPGKRGGCFQERLPPQCRSGFRPNFLTPVLNETKEMCP